MLYDATGKLIEEQAAKPSAIGERLVTWDPADRDEIDASRNLTPLRLDSIFREANSGDPRQQARLAQEIEEKDWDSVHALQTRRAAASGLSWGCRPKRALEDDKRAKEIAEQAELMLREVRAATASALDAQDDGLDFGGLVNELLGSALPGYSLLEILWGPGGKSIEAFVAIDRAMISFDRSRDPLLVSRDNPRGLGLVPNKFVWHRHQARSGDATRGGLIRPLGWMWLFSSLGIKDVLRFVEKFGMPFVSARIDENAWQKDRSKIAYLIRNFGSDGGAVFSKAVELELLNGATDSGEVYFRLLEYMAAAKEKVIIGQTATSGDAGGFSKGMAQADVRQDILESDCHVVSSTIGRSILAPWVAFNFGPDAPVPEHYFACEPPEDMQKVAEWVGTLGQAGYRAEPEWVEQKFGIPLVKGAPVPAKDVELAGDQVNDAKAANVRIAEMALAEIAADSSVTDEWLGPVQDAIDEALEGLPESDPSVQDVEEFFQRLERLLQGMDNLFRDMDSRKLEDVLARAMFGADVNGRLEAAEGVNRE